MKYTSIDQWKSKMRKLAKENNIDVQDMQQRYVLEEFAQKIGHSKYKDSIILKGGFVVSAILGIDERKTRDIDFTYNSTIYDIDQVKKILEDIISTETDSFFDYKIVNIKEEQLDDNYPGYSCTLEAINGKARLNLKLDISNDTLIYPKGIKNRLQSFIDDNDIVVMTYPIENIIAEKYETTLDRGVFNTRMRDLFDVYYLFRNTHHLIDEKLLARTIIEVSKDRGTYDIFFEFDELIDELMESKIFNDNFERFKKNNCVYHNESLESIFEVFKQINHIVQNELMKKTL